LALIKEATEVLDCINWKDHKLEQTDINESNLVEELIDVFKYYLAIVILWGIDQDRFLHEFERKSVVVAQKFEQEKLLKITKHDKICAIDIDGILYPWPESFVKFYTLRYPHLLNVAFTEVSKMPIFYQLKEEYRLSGVKAREEVLPGAADFTKYLKDQGYTIILLTARPYERYQRVYADTLEWLHTHQIAFDAIIWNENKEKYLYDHFPHVSFVVDDEAKNITQLANYGFKIVAKRTPYNRELESLQPHHIWFDSLTELKGKI
jgi:uncharacterized HAD superfamily protein